MRHGYHDADEKLISGITVISVNRVKGGGLKCLIRWGGTTTGPLPCFTHSITITLLPGGWNNRKYFFYSIQIQTVFRSKGCSHVNGAGYNLETSIFIKISIFPMKTYRLYMALWCIWCLVGNKMSLMTLKIKVKHFVLSYFSIYTHNAYSILQYSINGILCLFGAFSLPSELGQVRTWVLYELRGATRAECFFILHWGHHTLSSPGSSVYVSLEVLLGCCCELSSSFSSLRASSDSRLLRFFFTLLTASSSSS